MQDLNDDQKKAVKNPAGKPLLIVAGAGTGKTKTLTSRLAKFLEDGVPGDSILAITFTNKAAKEMASRVAALSNAGPARGGRPFIGTFHSFGAYILRKHAPLAGRSRDFAIFDDHDSFSLLKKVLKAMDMPKESPALMRDAVGALKNGSVVGEPKPKVLEVFNAYEAALERNDAFDFDDLLIKTVGVLKANPQVLRRYQERFTHILVDEYQDLNDVQYELIRLLAHPDFREDPAKPASLSVVGDAEQTIYGWRGSNIGIFLAFPEHWPDPEMVTLTRNYRSTGHILGGAAGVIKENIYATKVARATDLWTSEKGGEKILVREAADEEDEAFWIADKISNSQSPISNDPLRTTHYALRTNAILYRTNAQSRALEQALLRRRIPYRVYGGLRFYERKEIKDIVAGLRLALNPKDEVSRDRIEKQFSKRLFRALVEGFAPIEDKRPLTLIGAFLKIADYFTYMDQHLTNPVERRENVEELIRFAGEYEDLPHFLQEIALLQTTDEVKGRSKTEDYAPEVILSTIHLAKGLEFDRVFIAGANEGFLPHSRSTHGEEEIQEERRLMYVAMTRARKELSISFYGIPSRFIGEIPEEHARYETSGGKNDFSEDFSDYEERYISFD